MARDTLGEYYKTYIKGFDAADDEAGLPRQGRFIGLPQQGEPGAFLPPAGGYIVMPRGALAPPQGSEAAHQPPAIGDAQGQADKLASDLGLVPGRSDYAGPLLFPNLTASDDPNAAPVKTVVNTTSVGTTGNFTNQDINGILSGVAWSDTSLTYSFPTAASNYGAGYTDPAPASGFQVLTSAQQNVVRYALGLVSQYTPLLFAEITETDSVHATLRFAGSSHPPTSYAYYPSTDDTGGDAFFGNIRNSPPTKAGYEFDTFMHELGHALGLKHGQQDDSVHGVLPAAHDSTGWSIMDYHSYVGADDFYRNQAGSGNQTYMTDDIAALQYMYGANFSTNAGDTIYSWSPTTGEMFINGLGQGASSTNTIYEAIWDGNGTDTYDLSNYATNLSINLLPGEFSTFSAAQLAFVDSSNTSIRAPGEVANADEYNNDPRSLIENAKGGSGNDQITGNSANNTLYGGAGNDTLDGGSGNDALIGNAGNNTLIGGAGADTVDYSTAPGGVNVNLATGNASSNGYGGTDTLSGIEIVVGTAFADTLVGGTGSEYLVGGAGNDVLAGGAGQPNTLQGGTGNDTYVVTSVGDTVLEFAGEGIDTWQTTLNTFVLPVNLENLTFIGTGNFAGTGNSADNVIVGGAGNDTLIGGAGSDYLIGGSGNDTLIGGVGQSNTLQGGAGNDIYAVEVAGDSIIETPVEGIDQVQTNLSTYTLPANVENLTYTGAGNFNGTGNGGDNTMVGGAGDDTLAGGAGSNTLDGGQGIDTANYAAASAAVSINLAAGSGANGFGGTDTLTHMENVTGSAFADTLVGDGGDNVLDGGAGADYLIGGSGNDTLIGGTGAGNTLQGGVGNDLYVVGAAGDSIIEFANEGVDMVQTALASLTLQANVEKLFYTGTGAFTGIGNSSDNVIVGGAGADYLVGGAGDDTLDGGTGAANTMQGGLGNDTFIVSVAGDSTLEFANEGFDVVQTALSSFTLQANVEKLVYTGAGGFSGFGNSGNNTIVGGTGADYLVGAAGDDSLFGGVGSANTLQGGTGNDTYFVEATGDSVIEFANEGSDQVQTTLNSYTLSANVEKLVYSGGGGFTGIGNDGDNTVVGGTGADYLIGGGGDDSLFGGVGAANTLQGGTGNDTYFVEATGDSVIEFANEGNDQVQTTLSLYTLQANIEMLVYSGAGGFTGIGNGGDNVIVGGAGADYLIGAGGDDTLTGGAGSANTLQGGTGNDIYVVAAAGDSVIEFSGEGNDRIQTTLNSYTLPANVEELVFAGSGNFTGIGNGADNAITGGAGNDTLTGGGGADRFVFLASSGSDTITDFSATNGAAEHDVMDLTGRGLKFSDLTVTAAGSDTIITLHGADVIHLTGVSAAQIDAADFLF